MEKINRPLHHNNFDFMRLFAALSVLFSHLFQVAGYPDPLKSIGYADFSSIGMAVFFSISGYLVTASIASNKNLKIFFTSRFLRIYPAVIIISIITVFIVGPLITKVSLKEYFEEPSTFKFLRNIFIFGTNYQINSILTENPVKFVVNASLWSLEVELRCYILTALLFVFRILNFRVTVLISLICFVIFFYFSNHTELKGEKFFGIKYLELVTHGRFLFFYFVGASLKLSGRKISIKWPYVIGFIITAMLVWYLVPYGQLFHIIFLPFVLLWFCLNTKPVFTKFFEKYDFSYGIYLYSYPVQQVYLNYFHDVSNVLAYVSFVLFFSTLCAWLSWRFIEKPCLNLKGKFTEKHKKVMQEYTPE